MAGTRVLILGLGLSGIVAARQALAQGDAVTVYAGASSAATRDAAREFEQQGVPVLFDTEDVRGSYDLCVACPGIPATGAFYQSALAASAELISEPEFAWRLSPQGWLAVTGTNGKTTTTTLIAHLLRACGTPAALCGNTQATTVTDAVLRRTAGQAIVAELSSYQLASTRRFSPRVAVLLNITSDHLSWHGSQQAYAAAKCRVLANLGPGSCAVICAGVPGCEGLEAQLRSAGARVVAVGLPRARDCAYADAAGTLRYADSAGAVHALCGAGELRIKGTHNVENALAAAAAAIDFGCEPRAVGRALTTFEPLQHRIEPCGQAGGVAFYDDSKATNVDATLKALTAFAGQPVVLLVGGRDKGTELAPLVRACGGTCRAVVCYGEGGPRFFTAFEGSGVACVQAGKLAEAFQRALELACPGDAVLLSPACASFDEFTGFAQRGDVFKQLVAQAAGQGA